MKSFLVVTVVAVVGCLSFVATALAQVEPVAVYAPRYPPLARSARIQGTAIVDCTVDGSGSVSATEVISGHAMLQRQAVEAAKKWRFGTSGIGETHVVLEFVFRIEGQCDCRNTRERNRCPQENDRWVELPNRGVVTAPGACLIVN